MSIPTYPQPKIAKCAEIKSFIHRKFAEIIYSIHRIFAEIKPYIHRTNLLNLGKIHLPTRKLDRFYLEGNGYQYPFR
jgi:hypothetical protein